MQQYDVVVVGGGMVGSATALGLAKLGYSVALIEQHYPDPFNAQQPPDLRVSAISLASERLLQKLNAWSNIKDMRTCVYRRLSVWEDRQMSTDFHAADVNTAHLGHIVENRLVQLGILQALNDYPQVTIYSQQQIKSFNFTERPIVEFNDNNQIQSDWLVAADGVQSGVRRATEIGTSGWQYRQQALGITIRTTQPQQDITWQQFTPDGPLAFLPLYDGFASLVWYHSAQQIAYLKSLGDEPLKQQILAAFPNQLADFEILQRASFPLQRMHANRYYQGRVLLVGDAAHSINPLAGQGVNLGFKDVNCLLTLLEQQPKPAGLTQIQQLFAQYQQGRKADNLMMMSGMDALYKTFSNTLPPVKLIRNLVLGATNKVAPLKAQLMKYAMGIED